MTGKCCKCEEFKWPDDPPLEIAWTDPADGRGYCVFHAPKDQKWKGKAGQNKYSLEDFNKAVFLRIDSIPIYKDDDQDGIVCHFSGTVFPGDISFSLENHYTPLPHIVFSSAQFHGVANFALVKFSGFAIFERTVFYKKAVFSSAEFNSVLLFNWTEFDDLALFVRARFSGPAQFVDCKAKEKHIRLQWLSAISMRNVSLDPMDLQKFSFEFSRWPRTVEGTENLFRALKQRAIEECDQLQISQWSYHEKLMQLRHLLAASGQNTLINAFEDDALCDRNRIQALWELFHALPWEKRRSLLLLYWICSGFGERPRRAFACLASLAFLPLLILIPLKLLETGWNLQPDIVKIAEVFAEWVRCMPLVKLEATVTPASPLVSVFRAGLSWIFQVAIALQATLFALAVRNRFRR